MPPVGAAPGGIVASAAGASSSPSEENVQEGFSGYEEANIYGIDLSLYARLWRCGGVGVVPMSTPGCNVLVPHTIVFMHGMPFAWYFSSVVDGSFKKRHRRRLTIGKIDAHFQKLPVGRHAIVAVWMVTNDVLFFARHMSLIMAGGFVPIVC